MKKKLPPPLIDPATHLPDADSFMLNVDKLVNSELLAISSGDEFKAAMRLWCSAWKQTPPGSLPHHERALASFAGVERAEWPALRDVAMRGFVLCSDGRLYHPILCADAMNLVLYRQKQRDRTAAATEARMHVKRDEHRDVKRDGSRDVHPVSVPVSVPVVHPERMAVASTKKPLTSEREKIKDLRHGARGKLSGQPRRVGSLLPHIFKRPS